MSAHNKNASGGSLVYSSEHGRICPDCGKPQDACSCRTDAARAIVGDGTVRIKLETKGRKGKGVTVISGLALPAPELTKLAKQLKQRCSSGGTVKDGTIEIQGDHRTTASEWLKAQGHRVKG